MKVLSKNGFTLIELIIAITIIGILSVIALGGFNFTRARSRDAQRKADLKQISSALELLYSDHGRYPDASVDGEMLACPYEPAGNSGVCTQGSGDAMNDINGTIYMRELPTDPGSHDYYYRSLNANQGYQLYAHLENSEDGDCMRNEYHEVDCDNPQLPSPVPNCGGTCNFAITSTNVSPTD